MGMPSKVMVIRHGEKPTNKHAPPYGINADGEQDWDSLTVRGWLRAGALQALFAPIGGQSAALATPSLIYASKPRDPSLSAADDDASKSKRPLQTIAPLASKLKISPNLSFGKGDEAALVGDVLSQICVVLISWQHEKIYEIASHLVGTNPPQPSIPSKWPDDRFDLVWIFEPPASAGRRWSFVQIPQNLLKGDTNSVLA
jgi:broad specificity phosphatase PhoE